MDDVSLLDLPFRFAFDGPLGRVLHRHALNDIAAARLSWKFKAYYRIRPWIPIALRQRLQRGRNRSLDTPADWYLPTPFLRDWQQACQANVESTKTLHPWPDGFRVAMVLTHDVETRVGARLAPALASLEEEYGFRSAWNFVPYKYKIDAGLLDDLRSRGHEIGVHGYNHDGRLFESRRTFDWRKLRINEAIEDFGSKGFRAPMVHRNLQWLQGLNVDYDASCFDVDPFQAMPGGIGSPWPFIAGKFVELPYTLPQDHTLLVALGETTPRVWIDKLEYLRRIAGMAMLITHPDYLDTASRLDVYRQFLEYLREQTDLWHALPHEVATWWRQRDQSTISPTDDSIDGPAASRGRVVSMEQLFAASDCPTP
ncbi:hypothetical protein Poly24_14930 [Rosistilla carotiformis]|uniref:Polysaccharide deacetylase n=1 Tax=Rosistilla carotiformis TaxID=2528017 RepID=A0A518JQG5_9BACT|nr:hypothetical protein [Rosistilla carotiformis]QDV67789.1 hypothetical protein Poly24_14930 [Rosistilla carotiformis]